MWQRLAESLGMEGADTAGKDGRAVPVSTVLATVLMMDAAQRRRPVFGNTIDTDFRSPPRTSGRRPAV